MEKSLKRKLEQLELIETLPTGDAGVRVTLQYQPRLSQKRRSDRKAFLDQQFNKIANHLQGAGCQVELNTLTVSSQTVEAVIPIEQYDAIEAEMNDENVRLDVVVDRLIAT